MRGGGGGGGGEEGLRKSFSENKLNFNKLATPYSLSGPVLFLSPILMMYCVARKPSSGFSTRSYTNWAQYSH